MQETEEERVARLDGTLLRMQGRILTWKWFEDDPERIAPSLEAKAAEAKVLIALTKRQMEKGELTFDAGASEVEHHLKDYAVIGAFKMARKELTIPQWNDEMISEFGDSIRLHLRTIRISADHVVERQLLIQNELQKQQPMAQKSKSGNAEHASAASTVAYSRRIGLNRAQSVVLIVGAAVIAVMCLFPPWNDELEYIRVSNREPAQARATRPAGYHFLITPPSRRLPESDAEGFWPVAVRVDLTRLAIQCFVVVVLAGGLTILLRRRNS